MNVQNLLNSASKIMENAHQPYLKLDVPLKVEGGSGSNWFIAH